MQVRPRKAQPLCSLGPHLTTRNLENKIASAWYPLLATLMHRWEVWDCGCHVQRQSTGFPLRALSFSLLAADVTGYSRFLVVTYIQPEVA